jgi:hypothetical protein
MKYTCSTRENFGVRNYVKEMQSKSAEVTLTLLSEIMNLKFHLDNSCLNCETDWISGWVRGHIHKAE